VKQLYQFEILLS